MPQLPGLAGQQLGYRPDGVLPEHHAGGVVGGVQQQHPGLFGDGALDDVHIQLEVGPAGHDNGNAPGLLGIDHILGKEGRGQDDLLAGVQQRGEADGQGRGGAGGKVDALAGAMPAETPVEIVGHRLPDAGIAGGGGIGVKLFGGDGLQQGDQGLGHLLRAGHAGVADAEVIEVFRADLSGALFAVLADLADDVSALAVV